MLYTVYLGILLCAAGSYALYDSASDVVVLTPSSLEKLVLKSDEVWVVEFFAPWCGHCKNLVEPYKKAAKALKGIVKLGAIDADEHKSIGQKYGITGFPTLKVFVNGKASKLEGSNTADGIVDGALKAVKDKAYSSLGKKGGSDKIKLYGHSIPWKKVPRLGNTVTKSSRMASIPWKRITRLKKQLEVKLERLFYQPRVVTTAYGKQRMQQLERHLFRRNFPDSETPRIVKAMTIQMRH